jgi:hypothetical protein
LRNELKFGLTFVWRVPKPAGSTTIGTESPNAWATPPNAFSEPGPCCMQKTPIRWPDVSRLTASAMCSPTRSWRTMIVRMSASAAASMIGLTG